LAPLTLVMDTQPELSTLTVLTYLSEAIATPLLSNIYTNKNSLLNIFILTTIQIIPNSDTAI